MKVVTVTATYKRPKEIARLLDALRKSTVPIHGVVVVDNARDVPTQLAVAESRLSHRYVAAGSNLGCGGGLRLAEETALKEFPELTHVWILDDDTVPEPDTLQTLLAAMASRDVGATCPQAVDAKGRLNWYPGLLDGAAFKVLRRSRTPDDFLVGWGGREEGFSWATGVALLVTRSALDKAGLHRGDFWVRGEDLDFSLRITAQFRGLYVPGARLAHLPPGGGQVVDDFPERMKHAAMLQNCAYLAVRTKHGRRLASNWPGNAFRHLKRFGLGAFGDVFRAAWLGNIRGRPAGVEHGDYFRKRLEKGK